MSTRFKPFESIGQYRSALKELAAIAGYNDRKFTAYGHVKMHGTNAGITLNRKGELITQSRNNILSINDDISGDNAGFAAWVKDNQPIIMASMERMLSFAKGDHVTVFGEWCGGAIQKKVGLANFEKHFVVFKVTDGYGYWTPRMVRNNTATNGRFFESNDYPDGLAGSLLVSHISEFQIEIDLDYPEQAQADLVEITNQVENRCPVASYMLSGLHDFVLNAVTIKSLHENLQHHLQPIVKAIPETVLQVVRPSGDLYAVPRGDDHATGVKVDVPMVGEGVVWTVYVDGRTVMFKVKGDEHTNSKVRTLAPVDIEKVESIRQFVESFANTARLEQGLSELTTAGHDAQSVKNTGIFIKWVLDDIFKEESDTVEANGLDDKVLRGEIAKAARKFFVAQAS